MKRFSEWSESDVALHNLRVSKPNQIPVPADAVEDESELQSDIRQWCRQNGWMCFGGSMAHRTRRTRGEPDMTIVGSRTIAFDDGPDTPPAIVRQPVILFIECKSKTGKLRPEQAAIAAGCARHGVQVHVVRSMSDFIALT